MDGNVNVIVTDGFTGNIALKTAEGTANFITKYLKENLSEGLLNKVSENCFKLQKWGSQRSLQGVNRENINIDQDSRNVKMIILWRHCFF